MSLRDFLFHEEPGITLYCGIARVDRGDEDKHAALVKIMAIARKALGRKQR